MARGQRQRSATTTAPRPGAAPADGPAPASGRSLEEVAREAARAWAAGGDGPLEIFWRPSYKQQLLVHQGPVRLFVSLGEDGTIQVMASRYRTKAHAGASIANAMVQVSADGGEECLDLRGTRGEELSGQALSLSRQLRTSLEEPLREPGARRRTASEIATRYRRAMSAWAEEAMKGEPAPITVETRGENVLLRAGRWLVSVKLSPRVGGPHEVKLALEIEATEEPRGRGMNLRYEDHLLQVNVDEDGRIWSDHGVQVPAAVTRRAHALAEALGSVNTGSFGGRRSSFADAFGTAAR